VGWGQRINRALDLIALSADEKDVDALVGEFRSVIRDFGFDCSAAGGEGRARFRGMLAWKHAFGDVTPESLHAFGGGTPFSIDGVPIARDTLRVDAGLAYAISDGASFDLVYSGEIAPGVSDHGLTATLVVRY
jgi:uncharacterized protein with beta-barrel porin domain